jgi:hypothetical protein
MAGVRERTCVPHDNLHEGSEEATGVPAVTFAELVYSLDVSVMDR